MSSMNEQVLSN